MTKSKNNLATNDLARKNRAALKSGDLLYLGDMANYPVRFLQTDHCKCNIKVKQFLGNSYKFWDGSPAYREVYPCRCCEYGHDYLPGVDNKSGNFIGLICKFCGMPGPDLDHPETYKANVYADRAFRSVKWRES